MKNMVSVIWTLDMLSRGRGAQQRSASSAKEEDVASQTATLFALGELCQNGAPDRGARSHTAPA